MTPHVPSAAPSAAAADDPYAAMLRGSVLPTLVVGVVAVVVSVDVGAGAAPCGRVCAGVASGVDTPEVAKTRSVARTSTGLSCGLQDSSVTLSK